MAWPPSVIVILTDQQRWDTTRVHGNPADVTPEFDGIARAGTHFSLAFTPQPVCAPARAALQTGCWPTMTGVFRNGIALPAGVSTLASVFKEAGYVTGYIGKWHLGGVDAAEAGPVPPGRRGGYRRWLASDLLEFTSDAYRTVLWDESGQPVRLIGYRSDALMDAAVRFVADHCDHRFLLFVSLLEQHHRNGTDDRPPPDTGNGMRDDGCHPTSRLCPPPLRTVGHTGTRGLPRADQTRRRGGGALAGRASRPGYRGSHGVGLDCRPRLTFPDPATRSTNGRRTTRPCECPWP
ncbi:sulfatase-like hydrolase/transferase [Streptomyces sp. NBC_00667]|nr:sulfatase-like hydrolase/transferase [Streptomyces sp. NBC_00539]